MINNNYEFSLQLYLKLESIEAIFRYCPLHKNGLYKYYKKGYAISVKKITNNAFLQFPSSNKTVQKNAFTLLLIEVTNMIDQIVLKLVTEKRKNVKTALEILQKEFEGLKAIL